MNDAMAEKINGVESEMAFGDVDDKAVFVEALEL